MGLTLRVTTWLRKRNHSLELSELKLAAGACAVLGVVQPEGLDSVELGNQRVVLELPDAARPFLLRVASAETERGSAERERGRRSAPAERADRASTPRAAPECGRMSVLAMVVHRRS